LHQISDDLTLSSSASFSSSHFGGSSGNQQSWAVSIGMQYLISQTLAATASYSFFDYLTSAQNILIFNRSGQNQSYYQNLVLVGLTKQF
jgi:opacity protein-like surface antigen